MYSLDSDSKGRVIHDLQACMHTHLERVPPLMGRVVNTFVSGTTCTHTQNVTKNVSK